LSTRRLGRGVGSAAEDLDLQERIAREIERLFPGCPGQRAREIARHTGTRGSGRVGRTAAGRELDSEAIGLAVAASVRHLDTRYDELLMSGMGRVEARDLVQADTQRIVDRWRR